jgi:MFS family permease
MAAEGPSRLRRSDIRGSTMPRAPAVIRSTLAALRPALANDGIRRLGISWTLGIAADSALTVVTLVTVFNRGGALPAALLGAIRMVPAVGVGMFNGALLQRFSGPRILVVVGLVRAACAGLTALVIATAGPSMADHQVTMVWLFVLATIAAAASAPVRPTQVTLMPAMARSPAELVAANTAWSTGEGLGAFGGPLLAGILMGFHLHSVVAVEAGLGFLLTAIVAAGLRFEQAADVSGGSLRATGGLRIGDGLRAVRRRPVLSWTMFGTYGQVVTRALLNALVVVAAIQLLRMGQSGLGLLSAALGLGGLAGAILALSATRSDRLIRTEIVGLVFWGLPLAAIGLLPNPLIALAAMVVIGISNAVYDVALFTILQRGSRNEERGPIMSVLEGVIGLGAISGSLLAPLILLVFGERWALVAAGAILPILALVIYRRIGQDEQISVVDEELVDLVRRVPAFAELPLTALERLAAGLLPVRYAAGEPLMIQGASGDRFIVIATGEIDVIVDGRTIHRLGPGSGVGEIALLRRSPRTATVQAVTDVMGYSVDAGTFLAAVAGPAAAAVTERMVQANLMRSSATD